MMSLLRSEERRRKEQADELSEKACKELARRKIPTPAWIIEFYAENHHADHHRILSSHVYWPEYRLRTDLTNLHQVARHAFTDFIGNEAAIAPFDAGGTTRSQWDELRHFVNAAQKDLLAYCAASSAFDETLSTLSKESSVPERAKLSQIRERCFESDVGLLVRLLRHSLLHTRNVRPNWSISHHLPDQHGRTIASVLRLMESEIEDVRTRDLARLCSARGKRNRAQQWQQALEYFEEASVTESTGNLLVLSRMISDHFGKVRTCYSETSKWLVSNISSRERDFYTLLRSRGRWMTDRTENAKTFIEQLDKSTNLGRTLSDFFDAKEIRNVANWPGSSEDQGRYIMALRYESMEFSDEMKRSLFANLERLRPTD